MYNKSTAEPRLFNGHGRRQSFLLKAGLASLNLISFPPPFFNKLNNFNHHANKVGACGYNPINYLIKVCHLGFLLNNRLFE